MNQILIDSIEELLVKNSILFVKKRGMVTQCYDKTVTVDQIWNNKIRSYKKLVNNLINKK
jgi:hypothetical protein